MENECAQRRRDILFLQDCLDGEEEHQRVAITEATRSEPTLQGVYIKLMSHSRMENCNKISKRQGEGFGETIPEDSGIQCSGILYPIYGETQAV